MAEPVVRIRNLSCWYSEDDPPILKDINLEVDRGQLVLLLGPSGSGKTALGLCLTGIIPHVVGAVEGVVEVDGVDVPRASVAEAAFKVGMVFQDVESMLAMLYVRDEVAFGPENLMLSRDEVTQRVDEALATMGLTPLSGRFVFELSGGQKQKVAIASVLSMRPPVLFLDEPVANLDPRSSREVLEVVAHLARDHAILLFDHRVDAICHLADRVVVLGLEGTVVADGAPREVFRSAGRKLVEDLGVWVPQMAEVGVYLSSRGIVAPERVALTVDEGLDQYGDLTLDGSGRSLLEGRQPPGDAVIRVESVSYQYPVGVQANKEVSFDISQGELVALVGPNGSGKTTIAKQMVGLLKPDSGRVVVAGMDTAATPTPELVKKIGFVFQYPEHQFVRDTVWDEVAFSLEVRGVPRELIEQEVGRELELFGLAGLADRIHSSLSGGEKRRLSVATMLISQPDILVLDEPTYGQDRANTRRMMQGLFRAVAEGGTAPTIILVTHDMKLVAEYAQRALVMREGELAFDGPLDELFERPDLETWANLEDPPVMRLCRRLRARGQSVPDSIRTPLDFAEAARVGPVAGRRGGS